MLAGWGGRRVDLPTYPFQHENYWLLPYVKPTETDAASAEFWDTVERGDLDSLATTLGLDAERDTRTALDVVLPVLSTWRRRHRDLSALDSWRYRIGWKPLGAAPAAPMSGRWLVVVPDAQLDAEVVSWVTKALTARGADVLTVALTQPDRATVTRQLRDVLAEEVSGAVSLLAMDETAEPGRAMLPRGVLGTFALVQELAARVPLWLVTRAAMSIGHMNPGVSPVGAQVWGLGRVAALEYPQRWGGLIDLPDVLDDRAATRFTTAMTSLADEDQLVVRATGVFARRLVRAPSKLEGDERRWRPRGTALITGGTGGLGAHVARWLASEGVEHLVLASRRGPSSPGAGELEAELVELGATVTLVACDVSERHEVEDLLDAVPGELTVVVHAAGIGQDNDLEHTTLNEFVHVVRAKIAGAVHLDELLGDRRLDAFVLFSSIAGVWGSGRQAAYAAANAFLDSLAERRRADGLPATSVAWGPWAGAGMLESDQEIEARLRRRGLAPLAPELAIRALHRALDHDESAIVVADVDWGNFAPTFTSARPNPLIGDLPEVLTALEVTTSDQEPDVADSPLMRLLANSSTQDRERAVLELVRAETAAVLGHGSVDPVAEDRPFRDLGFDSFTGVELRNRLNARTGLRLPATLVFDYPTSSVLADHLLVALGGATAAPTPVVSAMTTGSDEPIVIVGMACRYPGGVSSPEELWTFLSADGDAIANFPTDRGWSSRSGQGGFLYDASEFDAEFFGISPREAVAMDPQQRLLLETSWEALERAGIDPTSLRGSSTGVFAGTGGQDYVSLLHDLPENLGGHISTGNAASVISGRVSYVLGLEGPAVTIDTACSSSLVALHWAAQALRSGECDLALAGGVTVMATPGAFAEFDRQGGMASDGRCKSFAAAADGTNWSEGVGMLVVQRLSDAQRDGNPVLAVVRGSAINQDGASNGLSAPNGPSQQRVIRQALANAGLSPAEVDVVEAHGTGTTLGDPIEAQALLATYGQERGAEQPLLLGSVKSNIGHTQAAAGVAGIIKMVMAMRHGVVPRTLHVDEPTPQVDWESGAVALATEHRDWPEADRPRRAAVSSFGISGTNAHTILEQAPAPVGSVEPRVVSPVPSVVPWVLSAKSERALAAQAGRLVGHLRPITNAVDGPRPNRHGCPRRWHGQTFRRLCGDGCDQMYRSGAGCGPRGRPTPNKFKNIYRFSLN
ncbi:hypothetical protein C1701_25780 [Actinoalloteichus sp. AHMU CJ021]|nr:hypothetical protein C1701_25780 [Actinoalloteichus sp. AHMU CJ021]